MSKNLLFLLFILFCINRNLSAQNTKLGREVLKLTEYMASNKFSGLDNKIDDLSRMDSLFKKALIITNDNYSEALFALTFASVPYKFIPIKIPLTNIIINYPLVSADDSIFNKKNKNLPKYLYFDSPANNYGDKDKVAHFFGSAFISYSSNFFDLGDLIGYFVEVFEQNFKVQSSIDIRDLHTDTLGNIFGLLLKKNKKVLPSQVMLVKTLFYTRFHFP